MDRRVIYERDFMTDVASLRRVRVGEVLSLIEDHEYSALGVAPDVAELRLWSAGIKSSRVPIRDGSVPSDEQIFAALAIIKRAREAGRSIVVHCMGGLGRAGTILGCWRRSQRWSSTRALFELQRLRGPRSPETAAQRERVSTWPRPAPGLLSSVSVETLA